MPFYAYDDFSSDSVEPPRNGSASGGFTRNPVQDVDCNETIPAYVAG